MLNAGDVVVTMKKMAQDVRLVTRYASRDGNKT